MTPPRYNVPGQTVFVTVGAVGRSMRFVPTRPVRESIDFLFALLITAYGLQVHEFLWMSNHWHLVVTDPQGRLSEFLQEFNSRLSRQLNALRGTIGVNFERDPGIQAIADGAGVLRQAVYTLCNPIKARLVERLSDWKASSSLHMRYGETVTFARPKCGLWAETASPRPRSKHASRGRLAYRGRSKAPPTASLTLVRPELKRELSDAELRDEVLAQARAEAERIRAELRREGRAKVLGWHGVLRQSFLHVPRTPRELFVTRPRVAGVDPAECAALVAKIETFEKHYRVAREAFKTDREVEFPYGTLRMVQQFRARCATAPP